ncbi:MAG: gliding motility protein GldM [Chitinophagales bacterium]
MAGGKLTPRQKMINMMYLVLTALLALNVSTEVLNAFRLVNDGLLNSNSSLKSKNDDIYEGFQKKLEEDPVKAKEWYDKAQQVKKTADDLNKFIEDRKQELIKAAGGIVPETGEIEQRDNIDHATRMFVEENGKKGKELKAKIDNARAELLKLSSPDLQIPLTTESKGKKGANELGVNAWEFKTFNHVPVTAAVTILTKFQNDVTASEGAAIEFLIKKIGALDFKFDKLAAAVIAPSGYVLEGQPYKSEIFVAASSSTQNPEVFIGGLSGFEKDKDTGGWKEKEVEDDKLPAGFQKLDKMAAGKGQYETVGRGVGEKKYSGAVRLKNPKGGYTFYPFEAAYQVGARAVVIAPTKMNVLYIGVDNPMKISVPGVSSNDISASFQGDGALTKNADGTYTARVKAPGKTTINVSAKIDGKVQQMGAEEFRIKRIPDPVPTVGGTLRGGPTAAGHLKVQSGLVALLENFDFEARFNVVSFTMGYQKGPDYFEEKVSGPLFSAKIKGILQGLKAKQIVIFDDIKVVGPDGAQRKIPQLAFKII